MQKDEQVFIPIIKEIKKVIEEYKINEGNNFLYYGYPIIIDTDGKIINELLSPSNEEINEIINFFQNPSRLYNENGFYRQNKLFNESSNILDPELIKNIIKKFDDNSYEKLSRNIIPSKKEDNKYLIDTFNWILFQGIGFGWFGGSHTAFPTIGIDLIGLCTGYFSVITFDKDEAQSIGPDLLYGLIGPFIGFLVITFAPGTGVYGPFIFGFGYTLFTAWMLQ